MKVNPSTINLSDQTKSLLVESLNVALATCIDLTQQIKQAHWNIKGPQFFARHQLFDQLAVHTRTAADTMAERAATLGGYAAGTLRLAVTQSQLPEYDLHAFDGRQHIQTLVDRYSRFGKLLRTSIQESEKLKDPVTTDLFIEVLRRTELDLWFLESHLLT